MNEQKKNINCRICLRYDLKRSQKCFSLFETYNASTISEKIKYIANIDISEGDGLPDKICPDCLLQLETAIVFKQKCENSDKFLHDIVRKPQKICKVTFSVPVKKEVEVLFNDGTDDQDKGYSNKKLKEPADIKEKSVFPAKTKEKECELPERTTENEYLKERIVEEFLEELTEEEYLEESTEKVLRKSKAIDLKLICDDCGGSFKSKCKLAVHWKKIHLPTKLVCPYCKRMFKSFKAFNVHKNKKTRSCLVATKVRIEGQGRSRLFHCQECTYNTKRIKDMDAHLATHSGDRRYQCSDCPKSFTQHSSLQGHRESTHKDYRVDTTCHYCGKHIQGRCKYYKHLRTHEPKSAQCEVCKKMLKSRSSLITHMKRHSGVRSYTCETCSANFYTTGELCNHRKRVHFKTKSFCCDMCEYSTYTATALKMHRSRHTLNNVICLMCGTFVESAEKLEAHQKRHLEKNFPCPHCDKTFFLRDSIRRHIVKKHGCMVKPKQETIKENTTKIKQECTAENKFNNDLPLPPIIIS